jgi:hypothetical protein
MSPTDKKIKVGFIDYLRSGEAFSSRNYSIVSLSILLTWLIIVIIVCAKHELWRDEVRALSIAIEPDTFWELPSALVNEGHPILWYLILRIGFFAANSPVILKIASVFVAFVSVVIFYRYSPFPLWQKILFLGGVLPFYEYSVMARNYGISMLLFFLFALFYTQRKKRSFLVAVILVALANTNAPSCILVCVFTAHWFFEDMVFERRLFNFRRVTVFACSCAFIGMGIFYAVFTAFPTQDTIVTKVFSLEASQVLKALWTNIKHPGIQFEKVFHGLPVSMRDLLVWLLFAGLLIRPLYAVSFFMGVILLGLFFSLVYQGSLRHEGLFIIFTISLYWIVSQKMMVSGKGKRSRYLLSLFKVSSCIVLSTIMVFHILYAGYKIHVDLTGEMSSAKAFGEFINENPKYKEAIIVGEPDYMLESLPYYVCNQIYITREMRFRNYVKFTRESKKRLALSELLNIARQIGKSEMRPVLIALGYFDIDKQPPPFEKRHPYNYKIFTWSSEGLSDFRASTVKIAEFKSAKSERYEIYLLREKREDP